MYVIVSDFSCQKENIVCFGNAQLTNDALVDLFFSVTRLSSADDLSVYFNSQPFSHVEHKGSSPETTLLSLFKTI